MFLLLLACAARGPSPPLDVAAPVTDALPLAERVRAALAADIPEETTPLRATVVAIGPFELAPGTRVFSPEPTEPFDTVVVADEGAVVRVLDETAGIRVVVGVRREDLAVRPDDRTPLAPAPDGKVPDDAFVVLAGGTPVTVGERAGDAVRITWQEEGIVLDGWAPVEKLVPVWRVTTRPEEKFWSDLRIVDPTNGDGAFAIALRDAPNGNVLATLRSDAWVPMRSAGLPTQGWRLVELRGDTLHARGWVPAEAVVSRERVGRGTGWGTGTLGLAGMRVAELAAGTWIRREGAPEPYGRAVRDAEVQLVEDDGTRLRVRLRSAWGWLPGEVDCPRRGHPMTKRAEIRCEG